MKNPESPVLVVDDIKTNLLFISNRLNRIGITNIIECQDSREVFSILEAQEMSLLLLDIRMPNIDGSALLPVIKEEYPDLPVIIVTEVSDVTTAVSCMQNGAFDYITKPVDSTIFTATIKRALVFRRLERENAELKRFVYKDKDVKQPELFSDIITGNQTMIRIFQYIEAVAGTSEPVLITGETGVGKELIARAVHKASGLSGELVTVNIAGLDDTVVSDTLFGHAKGAFTGADKNRLGLIEQAKGGTLFLDEIGDLATASQVKLLRLLQEGEYLPLGEDKIKYSSARIVVATNEDVFKLQTQGKFRKDLIYRLKTHHINVPPLRDRKEDIPLLVKAFIKETCAKNGLDAPLVSDSVYEFLSNYLFPGNIRELKAMLTDAVSRSGNHLSEDSFKDMCMQDSKEDGSAGSAFLSAPEHDAQNHVKRLIPDKFPTIREMTDTLIQEAMKLSNGNQTAAARLLGISQPALNKRLKKTQSLANI